MCSSGCPATVGTPLEQVAIMRMEEARSDIKGIIVRLQLDQVNASLDAGTRRAIDITQDHQIDDAAFVALIEEAAAGNG